MDLLPVKTLRRLLVPLLITAAVPAAAQQQSQGYKFLEAVRKADGDTVVKMLDQPGQRIVNSRDITTGEGALHIVVKRGDSTYLRFLLQRGADPNMRDGRGDTPLLLAVQYGQNAIVDVLTANKANPNLGNGGGETPLIRAVQKPICRWSAACLPRAQTPTRPTISPGCRRVITPMRMRGPQQSQS